MRYAKTCQWVPGDGGAECGAPSSRGSYCAEHAAIVYRHDPMKALYAPSEGITPRPPPAWKPGSALKIAPPECGLWLSCRPDTSLSETRTDRINQGDHRELDFDR